MTTSVKDSVLLVVLNVKALVGTFNQEKALEGAFSVIVQLHRLIGYSTSLVLHNGYNSRWYIGNTELHDHTDTEERGDKHRSTLR